MDVKLNEIYEAPINKLFIEFISPRGRIRHQFRVYSS